MTDKPTTNGSALCWPKRLLSADDLRRHLTSQKELVLLPKTVVTPLAADELRAKGIRVRWESATSESRSAVAGGWFYAMEKRDAFVESAVQALGRDGVHLTFIEGSPRTCAEAVLKGHAGGIAFWANAAALVCIANKIAGVRAACIVNAKQAAHAQKSLGANLYAIDVPGPTLFEIRHMLKTIVAGNAKCPDEIAKTLQELDGHAHR
jgi:hypothetical protein